MQQQHVPDLFGTTPKQDDQEFKIVVLDNGAFHHAKSLTVPDNTALIFLSPNNSEFTPAGKVWWMIQKTKSSANSIFAGLLRDLGVF